MVSGTTLVYSYTDNPFKNTEKNAFINTAH